MAEPTDPDDLADALQHRIADALGDAVLVKFVAVMEVVDTDGERALFAASSRDCKAWEALGMLTYAAEIERAEMLRDAIAE